VPGDVPGIHELVAGIYEEYGFRLDLAGVDRMLVDPGSWCREHEGEFWVLVDGDEVRGTVGVLLSPETSELKGLYVHHSYRRDGWGRRLTVLAMDLARFAGRRSLFLWTDTRFVQAHQFYESLGFRRTGEVRELHDDFNSREFHFSKALI
jgi:putative acetyltransferase